MLKNIFFSGNSNWVFPWSLIIHVFGFLIRYFLRFSGAKSVENGSILDDHCSKSEENSCENELENMGFDQIEEKEIPKLEGEVESVCNGSNTNKYQFFTRNSVCAFIEEPPPTIHFTVQEIFVISHDESSPKQYSLDQNDSSPEIDFSGFSLIHKINIHDDNCEGASKENEVIDSCVSNSDDFWATIHKYDSDFRVDYDQDNRRSSEEFVIDHDIDSPYTEIVPEFEIENDELSSEIVDEDCCVNMNMSELRESENEEMMEQRELIRQMKKEMRQLKISGLPTILEESESPRVEEDLRPLKIDERIRHKDRMEEIQTFYRRYLDKMRKLDILSQQTMYAIGLLQLKNQDLAMNKKLTVPVIKSLLAQNFWSNKLKKHEADPVQKLIRDLQRDLELAYVGQLCLSWEMLKWQHNKAEELHAHDPDGFRQHNQVAGEFQKFQVLLQRFIENEPFHQGPRVQHYVKSRCGLPALLQVPLIKDDPKVEWRRNEEDGISIRMLKEVIVASMRSFWDFLRADKDEVCAIPLIGIHGVQVILQDPSDADLLTEIRSSLQKKEKRLKDLVRSGNCLVKKFKKHQDQRLSNEMLIAQVELRLVSRVLSMPKLTTDQLLWCHKKLNKIDIIGRKIYLEYSFLLFPC